MLETTPLIPDLMPESTMVDRGFQSILDYIDERSSSPYRKGELFEKVMRQYFLADPIYKDSFSEVYLWNDNGRHSRDLRGLIRALTLLLKSGRVAIVRFSANVMVPILGFKNRILIHLSLPRR